MHVGLYPFELPAAGLKYAGTSRTSVSGQALILLRLGELVLWILEANSSNMYSRPLLYVWMFTVRYNSAGKCDSFRPQLVQVQEKPVIHNDAPWQGGGLILGFYQPLQLHIKDGHSSYRSLCQCCGHLACMIECAKYSWIADELPRVCWTLKSTKT